MTLLFHRLFRLSPYRPIVSLRPTVTASVRHYAKPLPPRPTIDEGDITEAFLKGTGPGGQKINKTSSAVQLKHLPTGLVIKCQETRSRSQNRKIARRLLAEKIEDLEKGDQSRSAMKLEKAQKKKASKDKKSRRKYRKLADGEDSQLPSVGEAHGNEHAAQPGHGRSETEAPVHDHDAAAPPTAAGRSHDTDHESPPAHAHGGGHVVKAPSVAEHRAPS